MDISFFTIQTPALLFPTVSLLMLAYTNRFLGITSVIRKLHTDMSTDESNHQFYFSQIQSLSLRINLIVLAQKTGVMSLLSCVLSMIVLMISHEASFILFSIALIFMAISLIMIFKELSHSKKALNYILDDCKKMDEKRKV